MSMAQLVRAADPGFLLGDDSTLTQIEWIGTVPPLALDRNGENVGDPPPHSLGRLVLGGKVAFWT